MLLTVNAMAGFPGVRLSWGLVYRTFVHLSPHSHRTQQVGVGDYWASWPLRDSTSTRTLVFISPPYSVTGWAAPGRAWFWARKANPLWSPRKLKAVRWQRSRLEQGAVPEGDSGWHILDTHHSCHLLCSSFLRETPSLYLVLFTRSIFYL